MDIKSIIQSATNAVGAVAPIESKLSVYQIMNEPSGPSPGDNFVTFNDKKVVEVLSKIMYIINKQLYSNLFNKEMGFQQTDGTFAFYKKTVDGLHNTFNAVKPSGAMEDYYNSLARKALVALITHIVE